MLSERNQQFYSQGTGYIWHTRSGYCTLLVQGAVTGRLQYKHQLFTTPLIIYRWGYQMRNFPDLVCHIATVSKYIVMCCALSICRFRMKSLPSKLASQKKRNMAGSSKRFLLVLKSWFFSLGKLPLKPVHDLLSKTTMHWTPCNLSQTTQAMIQIIEEYSLHDKLQLITAEHFSNSREVWVSNTQVCVRSWRAISLETAMRRLCSLTTVSVYFHRVCHVCQRKEFPPRLCISASKGQLIQQAQCIMKCKLLDLHASTNLTPQNQVSCPQKPNWRKLQERPFATTAMYWKGFYFVFGDLICETQANHGILR